MPIEFLSFPVQSGKTTWLQATFEGRRDVFGFLTPGGPTDRRLRAMPSGEERPYAATQGQPAIEIGRFRLDPEAFEWGLAQLEEALRHPDCRVLVIDEIGLLELRENRGFAPGIDRIIAEARTRPDLTTYLVVRDFLLEEARQRFNLPAARVNDPALFAPLPPRTGLVLAGGSSSRMGRDKAFIVRNGQPAYAHAAQLLAPHCSRIRINGPAAYPPFQALPDDPAYAGEGPMSGLRTACTAHEGLLVLGVDYPELQPAALNRIMAAALLTGRSVCYRQAGATDDAALEPLVAYYAPQDLARLKEWPGQSLRRFLHACGACALPHDARLGLVSVDFP